MTQKDGDHMKKIIVALAAALILSVVLICFFNCPAYKTVSALKRGNSAQVELQLAEMDSAFQKRLFSLLLPSALKDLNESYNTGKYSYDDVEALYETVSSYEPVKTSEYQNAFRELASSKQSYYQAVSAMETLDYPTAISYYQKVISTDSLYKTAQQELRNATDTYKNNTIDKFYQLLLDGDTSGAMKVINQATAVVSDYTLNQMSHNLTMGEYKKLCTLMNNLSQWETITQSHAGENTYCCISIRLFKNDINTFECFYVQTSLNSLVQSGSVSSVTGPVACYRVSDGRISKLDYREEQRVKAGGYGESVRWDYTLSKTEKLKKLESLFFGR